MDKSKIASTGKDITDTSDDFSYPSGHMARYRWIYDDLCRYCNDMWGNIASIRIRAVEHVIFSASLLGLYLAFAAASEYEIGWWGLGSVALLTAVATPHLLLVVNLTKTDEFYLRALHSESPAGEPELMIIKKLEDKAEALNGQAKERGRKYVRAKNLWFIGIGVCSALVVLDWLL